MLAARRLQFLWCVQVKLFGPDTGVSVTASFFIVSVVGLSPA